MALERHIKYLDKEKFRPSVACSNVVPELISRFEEAGTKVFVIPFERLKVLSLRSFPRLLRSVTELNSVIERSGANLVVTNTERAMYAGTLAALMAQKNLFWWVRDFEYNRFLFRLLSRLPKRIICVSKAIRDYYGGQNNPKFEVVYVGSDFDEKLKEVRLADVLRVKKELGITEDNFVVGFVGRLVKWKGAQVLVAAAKGLRGIRGVKIVIVGSGKGQEGNIEPQLHQMIKEQGLEDQIVLAGHRQDVPVLMKAFDVFCHTSIEPEPFATVVVEAMLAGVPVIATNVGGTPEIVSDSQTGFLVPPSDPLTLAAVLSHLSRDQKLRQKIGRQGKNLVMARYTEAVVTAEIERFYQKIWQKR